MSIHFDETNILIPMNNPLGGIRTYVLAYFKNLHESGLKYTFMAPKCDAFTSFQEAALNIADCDFIEVENGRSNKIFLSALRKAIKSKRYSLIHSQGLKAGTLTSIANLFGRVPHLITLHDVIVPQNDIPGKFKWLKKRISGYFTRKTNVIIAVSEDCKANHLENFPEWKKGPCDVQAILNGIDIDLMLSKSSGNIDFDIRKELDIPEGIVLFGFFGRFMPQKGFLPLIEAVKILASRGKIDKFRIVATRDRNGYLEYIRAVENDEILSKNILFIEQQSDVSALLPQVDAVLMPSLWEACGLVAMESMVLGVPFIGSECIGLKEVMRNTPCMEHAVNDPTAIADAIEKYMEKPFNEEARNFMKKAREKFDVKIGVQKVGELYRYLLKK